VVALVATSEDGKASVVVGVTTDLTARISAVDLVRKASLLALPGTMFRPKDDPAGAQELRIAFANVNAVALTEVAQRLAAYRP